MLILSNKAVLGFDVTVRLDAFSQCVGHPVTELDGESEHLWEVFRQSRCANPAAQVTPADVFQEQKRLTSDGLHKVCLGNVLVYIQIDPSEGFLPEAVGNGRDYGQKCASRKVLAAKGARSSWS